MNRLLKTAKQFFILSLHRKTRFSLHRSDALTSRENKVKSPALERLHGRAAPSLVVSLGHPFNLLGCAN
jgi:hypothetical protein